MSLVVHVTQTYIDGRTHSYPFEADPSYYFEFCEELQEFRARGKAVLGKRLWLDRPMPSNFYGLPSAGPELNAPDRVRAIIGEKSWVIYPNYDLRIVPWVTSRIIRFED